VFFTSKIHAIKKINLNKNKGLLSIAKRRLIEPKLLQHCTEMCIKLASVYDNRSGVTTRPTDGIVGVRHV
jgi:hypothetical protein